MLLQMLIIVLLSSWIVEEYLNNIYLQAYVNDTIQADGSIIALLVIVGTLGVAGGLFKVLRSTHRQIGAIASQPQAPTLTPTITSSSKPALDLHPMVAALKADMAHQASMEPLPQLDTKDAAPAMPIQAPPPPPAPVKSLAVTPSTVITGTMPVLKRVNPDQDKNQGSRQ
jgi:hypothetical protein